MAKTLNVVTTYSSDTRVLRSVATMTGAIEGLPDQPIVTTDVRSITLFTQPTITAYDQQQVGLSASRAILAANAQLQQWNAAIANSDKADAVLATGIDPVATFDQTLTIGAMVDPVKTFDENLNKAPEPDPVDTFDQYLKPPTSVNP
jgi:hypothetical protein